MLVLTRKEGESITLAGVITITVLKTGQFTRIGIDAPKTINVVRSEVDDNRHAVVPTVPGWPEGCVCRMCGHRNL